MIFHYQKHTVLNYLNLKISDKNFFQYVRCGLAMGLQNCYKSQRKFISHKVCKVLVKAYSMLKTR
jgi:hypothetical protein